MKRRKTQNTSSRITNEPRFRGPILTAIREQLEHRALWMYVLNDEARKHGYDPAEWAPDAIRRVEDDHLDIDFHYCPLVKAWQKQGCTDEEIAELCDFAMSGDRGIISNFGGELDLQSAIAKGDPICKIRFVRKDVGEPQMKKVK